MTDRAKIAEIIEGIENVLDGHDVRDGVNALANCLAQITVEALPTEAVREAIEEVTTLIEDACWHYIRNKGAA
jgi:hypothetical protein